MSDAILDTITKIINSPPGQLAAGGVLAGFVSKCFERYESGLTDDAKLEIAVWLLDRKKFGPKVQPWPDTFAKLFDRAFGKKHLTWKCFWRSCIASYCAVAIAFAVSAVSFHFYVSWRTVPFVVLICGGGGNLIPDYLSLLETRWMLRQISKSTSSAIRLGLILTDILITTVIGIIGALVAFILYTGIRIWQYREAYCRFVTLKDGVLGETVDFYTCLQGVLSGLFVKLKVTLGNPEQIWDILTSTFIVWLFAAFFTSIWLWLYAGSGFILKASLRFDIGFDWFNRKFNIAEKPLYCIGLVAGALVAIVYWTAAIVSRVVG